tara:strand:- start:510 stop:734 length:225 start_codon:yes stop_codon:yes gene_type:complete
MSHWSTDAAIDNIQTDISSMSDVDVMNNLTPDNQKLVAKFTGDKINGANIMDYARDVLADQMFGDWQDGPDGYA